MSLSAGVGRLVAALDAAFPTNLVPVLRGFLQEHGGARSVTVYVADYDLLRLRALPDGDPADAADSFPVDESQPGRAFRAQTPTLQDRGDSVVVHLPVSVRAERVGVLSVELAEGPTPELLDGLAQAAAAVAYAILNAQHYTDVIERARRERPMVLPAELQWGLLPRRAYTCPQFALAGQLVPAYEVGGDLFDYAVDVDEVVLTVTDAMGHGLQASLLASLGVGALRNARRTGLSLADQVRFADRVLYGQFGGEQFVTALAVAIQLRSGQARIVNAGHPGLWLKRGAQIRRLDVVAQLPMGLFEATRYVEQPVTLHPGDRLVLVSDGVLEAQGGGNDPYGEQRLEGAILATSTLAPDETVRQLVRLLLDYQGDELRDDATVLCLDWHGSSGSAGA